LTIQGFYKRRASPLDRGGSWWKKTALETVGNGFIDEAAKMEDSVCK
jgi:hypothetical protein